MEKAKKTFFLTFLVLSFFWHATASKVSEIVSDRKICFEKFFLLLLKSVKEFFNKCLHSGCWKTSPIVTSHVSKSISRTTRQKLQKVAAFQPVSCQGQVKMKSKLWLSERLSNFTSLFKTNDYWGGWIAQRWHTCFSSNIPGFDSRHSLEFFSWCWWDLLIALLSTVDRGLIMSI